VEFLTINTLVPYKNFLPRQLALYFNKLECFTLVQYLQARLGEYPYCGVALELHPGLVPKYSTRVALGASTVRIDYNTTL